MITASSPYSGSTSINAGQLTLTGSLTATNAVAVSRGAGFTLSGSATGGQLNAAAPLTLGGTGTSGVATFTLDNTAASGASTVDNSLFGSLTIGGDAVLDLGTGSFGTHATFASDAYNAGTFTISNWSGNLAGGGLDQLLFSSAVDSTFLSHVQFSGFALGAREVSSGSNFEVVPVPEPSTLALAGLGLAAMARRRRRR
jgi:hypothetical protein